MTRKKVSELKEGNIIVVYGDEAIIKKIESSGKGIKQGRIKYRIEAETIKNKRPIVFIRLADEEVETK